MGAYVGFRYLDNRLTASAIGFWMSGVASAKKGEYDFALLYLSEAIAQKKDPLFYQSLAEVYEVKQNPFMSLQFYKLALEGYKKEKTGPIKQMEWKIRMLQDELQQHK